MTETTQSVPEENAEAAGRPEKYWIDLLRHGEVDGPAALYGRTDVPCTDKGQEQVTNSVLLDSYQQVLTSPLKRCAEPAQALAERFSVPLQTEQRFAEMDFGDWDGQPFDALQKDWSELEAFWADPGHHCAPNGETLSDFAKRVETAFFEQLEQLEGNALWVVHGGVIRVLLARLLGASPSASEWHQSLVIAHGSITRLCVMPGLIQVTAVSLPPQIPAPKRRRKKKT